MPKTSVLITKIKNAGKRVTEAVARIKQTFKNLDYTKNDDVNESIPKCTNSGCFL